LWKGGTGLRVKARQLVSKNECPEQNNCWDVRKGRIGQNTAASHAELLDIPNIFFRSNNLGVVKNHPEECFSLFGARE
jgi:hypothetical protein